jgi:hypothetical protein
MRLLPLVFGVFLAAGATGVSIAAPAIAAPQDAAAKALDLQELRKLLATPEGQIDFATAKLTIDRAIDPTIDAAAVQQKLDAMAGAIRSRFPVGASRRGKLDILLSFLYQPGPWNDQRPFSYDFDDPFGKNLRNKLLPTYLASRAEGSWRTLQEAQGRLARGRLRAGGRSGG